MSHQYQTLLDKVAIVKMRQEILQSEDNFNIFQILRSGHEEVSLHSRFLFELLNPKGSHGMGDVFLRSFIDVCEELPEISFDTVNVLREHANIDILIQDNSKSIVIENKIYAGDQHEQLKRYFEYAKNSHRQPVLVYLTLFGYNPSEQSLGGLKEHLKLISYKKEISNWITACINESALKPALRETLHQYKTLINKLTGNTMNEVEKQDILKLMAQGDNAEQAAVIQRNWNHVRWHMEWDFWTELFAKASDNYAKAEATFNEEALSKHVHGGNSKDWWYGITFPVGKLLGTDVIFQIERGEQEPIYYGLLNCSTDEAVIKEMRACIQIQDAGSNDAWAGFKYTKAGIDFHNYDNSATLQLANPIKRQKLVGELWQEIQDFISGSCHAFGQKFGGDFVAAN